MADDIEEAYNKIPEEYQRKQEVLANACMMRKAQTSLCVNIETYKVEGPESLEYENIPIWVFNFSVLISRYIREWNADAFMGETLAGPYCRELFEYSSRYLKLNIINLMIAWGMYDKCNVKMTEEDKEAAMPCLIQSLFLRILLCMR